MSFSLRSEKRLPDPRSESPGIGVYNTEHITSSFTTKKEIKSRYGTKRFYDVNYEKAKSSVPGPGSYELKLEKPKGSVYKSSGSRYIPGTDKHATSVPGPGYHNPRDDYTKAKAGSFSMSQLTGRPLTQ